jgi:hypothetical protein
MESVKAKSDLRPHSMATSRNYKALSLCLNYLEVSLGDLSNVEGDRHKAQFRHGHSGNFRCSGPQFNTVPPIEERKGSYEWYKQGRLDEHGATTTTL